MSPVLTARGIERRFGGVHALRGVDLELYPGETHALLGENGAGKSTLTGVCSGAIRPDAGTLVIDGTEVSFADPRDAAAAGIAVVHQEPMLAGELSILDNIMLPALARSSWRRRWGRDRGRVQAVEFLDRLGLSLDLDAKVRDLPISARQLVEIAKAVALEPRVLFLDEPNSALSPSETERLFGAVAALRADGAAVVLISHRMGEVFQVADRITVMRDGGLMWTGPAADTTPDQVIELISGSPVARDSERVPASVSGPAVLACEGLTRGGEFEDITLDVRPGEIVGVSGLVGSGRSELAACLFGATAQDAGRILVDGEPVRWKSTGDAIKAGIALVPEDRAEQSLFGGMSVRWNVESTARSTGRGSGEPVADLVKRLEVKTASLDTPVGQLSGGNQQKVVLARWLLTAPRLLILDEPTRGVDVGAKAQIYRIVRDLAAEGLAVLLISSEIEEISDLADRVVVMRRGRVGAYVRDPGDTRAIVTAAFGQTPPAIGETPS